MDEKDRKHLEMAIEVLHVYATRQGLYPVGRTKACLYEALLLETAGKVRKILHIEAQEEMIRKGEIK